VFNPYLPAIGRVLEVLAASAPVGTTIETTNRALAEGAGLRSASQIPLILRKLEEKNYIERVTTPRGSLIVVTERSGMADRSFVASESDQGFADRSVAADREIPNEMPDRSSGRSIERSTMADPPHTPLYGTQESFDQEEESARAIAHAFGLRPLRELLMADPAMNRSLAEQIAKNPPGTAADFLADMHIAETFAKQPFYFTVARWRDGQRVIAPEEQPRHERPAATRSAPTRARRRFAPDRPTRDVDPTPTVDYAALLAEWRATAPGGAAAVCVPGQRGIAYGD